MARVLDVELNIFQNYRGVRAKYENGPDGPFVARVINYLENKLYTQQACNFGRFVCLIYGGSLAKEKMTVCRPSIRPGTIFLEDTKRALSFSVLALFKPCLLLGLFYLEQRNILYIKRKINQSRN